ncbi:MAG: hypothetical protein KatS3mg078_0186 [Deltaproteobacteria bacterium]|jgi:hypothetical protein|nr:MAG: hypothetical protein KatS3mg078_0186 [Deltaproteobacteria bacterium]
MLKTNIFGSIIVCLILFTIIGYFFYLGVHINWSMYFKITGIVLAIAFIVGISLSGGNKK